MHKCQEPGSLHQEINKVFRGFIFGSTCIQFKRNYLKQAQKQCQNINFNLHFLYNTKIFGLSFKYKKKNIFIKILSYKIKIKTFSIEWYINFGKH